MRANVMSLYSYYTAHGLRAGVDKKDQDLKCSFCGKHQRDVAKLIAGPKVFICNECVEICNEVIDDSKKQTARNDGAIRDRLLRASQNLESARLLAAKGHSRVAIDLARTSSQS